MIDGEATLAENQDTNRDTGGAERSTVARGAPQGRDRDRGSRRSAPRRRPYGQRRGGRRRRRCYFCAEKVKTIDYKDVSLLRQYLNDRGLIRSRRRTSTCAKHQRMLARAIKRARHLALLPYTAEHVRLFG